MPSLVSLIRLRRCFHAPRDVHENRDHHIKQHRLQQHENLPPQRQIRQQCGREADAAGDQIDENHRPALAHAEINEAM